MKKLKTNSFFTIHCNFSCTLAGLAELPVSKKRSQGLLDQAKFNSTSKFLDDLDAFLTLFGETLAYFKSCKSDSLKDIIAMKIEMCN